MTPILKLENITKSFRLGKGTYIKASSGINLEICHGETLGIVGESGCGKSTLAKIIMGVYSPDCGTVSFEDAPLKLRTQKERLSYAKKAQMIFQDPFSSLNPRMTAGAAIEENLILHFKLDEENRTKRIIELLELVGLNQSHLNRFPHEFSGGQRQRIGIARALAVNPKFIVCDEPVSALDISIQSQIMNLLKKLKAEFGLTYIFISHDLNMVRYLSDRIAVMYMGQIVEIGNSHDICFSPAHPYTKTLLDAVLSITPSDLERTKLNVEHHQAAGPDSLCSFWNRCNCKNDSCLSQLPSLEKVEGENHYSACHLSQRAK